MNREDASAVVFDYLKYMKKLRAAGQDSATSVHASTTDPVSIFYLLLDRRIETLQSDPDINHKNPNRNNSRLEFELEHLVEFRKETQRWPKQLLVFGEAELLDRLLDFLVNKKKRWEDSELNFALEDAIKAAEAQERGQVPQQPPTPPPQPMTEREKFLASLPAHVRERKQKSYELARTRESLRAFNDQAIAEYRDELTKQGLSPKDTEDVLERFRENLEAHDEQWAGERGLL